MDAEKDNDGEENKEDTEKEMDLDDSSNVENLSNPADDSEENFEAAYLFGEGNFEADADKEIKDQETLPSQNIDDSLVPVKKNQETVETSKTDDIKQPTNVSKKLNSHHKEENVNGKKRFREGKPFTKVVIRRLPPSMMKDVFLDQVSPLPSYDYFYFVPANMSSTGSFSRAYINFTNQNDLFDFTRTFDNYVFIDSKGHEYPAIVEFAPYQRVPKVRAGRKKDSLMGTLESDPVYLTFKEQLQAEELENSRTTNKQHYFETEINESEEVVTTPLLEFLKARRAEKDRLREERREDRKRKEAERKLLKQKIKDKSQEEEIEIKICGESTYSFKTGDSSLTEEEEDIEVEPEEKVHIEEPTIKAILVKPKEKSEVEDNEKSGKIIRDNESKSTNNDDWLKLNIPESGDRGMPCDDSSIIMEDGSRSYLHNKSFREGWEHREPGDMYRFSMFRYWKHQAARSGSSSYRFTRISRNDSSPRDHETYYDWSSSFSLYNSSLLQPPKDKKEFVKDKDVKKIKHKEKEERFAKSENRTREFKNKGGKSYREERLKQAEKREEKKKKETEELKDSKNEAQMDDEIKEEEKFWSNKKKWKYEGGGDTKGGRTFTRRRDEKKKEMYDRKRGSGKGYRTRKGSGESIDDTKKDKTTENSEKSQQMILNNKSEGKESLNSPKKDKDLTSRLDDQTNSKKDNTSTAAQKSSKENDDSKMKEKENQEKGKESRKSEKDSTPLSEVNKKERLQKESSVDSEEGGKSLKDPRAERRIRNKDRPSIEIYRPGMGKFSRQRLEKEKTVGSTDESPSHSPSPTPNNSNKININ